MELSLDNMRAAGGFTGAPAKKQLKRHIDGEEVEIDVYVKKLSYYTALTDLQYGSMSGDSRKLIAASRIAHCIVDEYGKPIFKISDITGLNEDGSQVLIDGQPQGELSDDWTVALLNLIAEVNELGKQKAEKSPRKKKSGTS